MADRSLVFASCLACARLEPRCWGAGAASIDDLRGMGTSSEVVRQARAGGVSVTPTLEEIAEEALDRLETRLFGTEVIDPVTWLDLSQIIVEALRKVDGL